MPINSDTWQAPEGPFHTRKKLLHIHLQCLHTSQLLMGGDENEHHNSNELGCGILYMDDILHL